MQTLLRARGALVTVMIAVFVGIGTYAVVRSDPWAKGGSGLPGAFELNLDHRLNIDPELFGYQPLAQFPVPLAELRAIAVGPSGRIHVVGDRSVEVFTPDGTPALTIPVDGEPQCIGVAGTDHAVPGTVHVGVGRRIDLFAPDGKPAGSWSALSGEKLEKEPVLTSIAVSAEQVFLADAANSLVFRFGEDGKILGKIGEHDPERDSLVFSVPSAHFDVAMDHEQELLHIANPGQRQVVTYSPEGKLQSFWGSDAGTIEGFFGCCNPSEFALLPDGSFVTSEKGIPRVKVYNTEGEFECVVAGPEELGVRKSSIGDPRMTQAKSVFDVAVDADGRVVVLDPRKNIVRIFVRRDEDAGSKDTETK